MHLRWIEVWSSQDQALKCSTLLWSAVLLRDMRLFQSEPSSAWTGLNVPPNCSWWVHSGSVHVSWSYEEPYFICYQSLYPSNSYLWLSSRWIKYKNSMTTAWLTNFREIVQTSLKFSKRRHKCALGFVGLKVPLALSLFTWAFRTSLALELFSRLSSSFLPWEFSALDTFYSAITPLNFPSVERLVPNVTHAYLLRVISKELLSISSYYIRAPHSNEKITLFSFLLFLVWLTLRMGRNLK